MHDKIIGFLLAIAIFCCTVLLSLVTYDMLMHGVESFHTHPQCQVVAMPECVCKDIQRPEVKE
jgi:hypothetical protein